MGYALIGVRIHSFIQLQKEPVSESNIVTVAPKQSIQGKSFPNLPTFSGLEASAYFCGGGRPADSSDDNDAARAARPGTSLRKSGEPFARLLCDAADVSLERLRRMVTQRHAYGAWIVVAALAQQVRAMCCSARHR
jgi:hypothetical protein